MRSDFLEVMRRAMGVSQSSQPGDDPGSARWALLPGLCCQAAGGDPSWADEVAAAWLLFYVAADIMDHVEDRDLPHAWWAESGPGMALNAASGLFFTASHALHSLYRREATRSAARDIAADFHRSFLVMCSGQHQDLTHARLTLKKYWAIASAKSGSFFALACRSGARLATEAPGCLAEYGRFGRHLGLLVQILDDLEEFQSFSKSDASGNWPNLEKSLPAAYAASVLAPDRRARLRKNLKAAAQDFEAAQEAFQMIEQCGAALYLVVEIERQRGEALQALENATPQAATKDALLALVPAPK